MIYWFCLVNYDKGMENSDGEGIIIYLAMQGTWKIVSANRLKFPASAMKMTGFRK
jgi:hypothetical protein